MEEVKCKKIISCKMNIETHDKPILRLVSILIFRDDVLVTIGADVVFRLIYYLRKHFVNRIKATFCVYGAIQYM